MSVRWVFNDLPKLSARAREGSHRAARTAGQMALDRVNENTPVRSGRLRSGNRLLVNGNEATISNDTPYAIYVEFGTRHMAARAFMTRGLQQAEAQFGRLTGQEVGDALRGGR